jgi:hypothetical protein
VVVVFVNVVLCRRLVTARRRPGTMNTKPRSCCRRLGTATRAIPPI